MLHILIKNGLVVTYFKIITKQKYHIIVKKVYGCRGCIGLIYDERGTYQNEIHTR